MRTYDEVAADEATDQDLLMQVENDMVRNGRIVPLSQTTPFPDWERYWQSIADEYDRLAV